MQAVTKGAFAQILGVSPGRVSQMLSEGKIAGAAIVGEGREARINVDVAKRQLQRTLDPSQGYGANGKATLALDAPSSREPGSQTPETDDPYRAERLREIRFKNRRAAEDELARRGLYTLTDDMRAGYAGLAAQLLIVFEGALPELANVIAAKFEVPQRDVLHELRQAFREVRVKAAAAAKAKAETLPMLKAAVLAEDEEILEPLETANG